jgi:SAM-dependent MidA family methyltransferase
MRRLQLAALEKIGGITELQQDSHGRLLTAKWAGKSVNWLDSFSQVQFTHNSNSIVLAHELFDAMPIHQFQLSENGWREVLVDLDPDPSR